MDIETINMKIYVKGGARIECKKEYGITHFLEHMLFHGTKKFQTRKIANDYLNDNGGKRDGSTNISYSCYSGRILSDKFNVLLDVLSEMFLNPKILEENIKTEANVITEEIKRSRDDNIRQFNDLLKKNVFKGSYLERYDTMGSVDTIKEFNHDILSEYKNNNYTANNIIIGISGKFNDENEIINNLENLFGKIRSSEDKNIDIAKINPSIIYDERPDKKQVKMFIGFESIFTYERKYDYENMCISVFESALTRRLSNILRDNGFVYAFGLDSYGDRYTIINGFKTGLSVDNIENVISIIAKTSYDILYNNHVTSEELNRKNAMIKLGRADFFESSLNRRDRLINFYDMYNELYNPAEFDDMREKITVEDVMKYAKDYFSKPISIIAEGPKCDIDMKKIWEENFK